jgi:hypothetical protein
MSTTAFRTPASPQGGAPIGSVGDLTRELLGLAAETGAALTLGALGVARRSRGIQLPRRRKACACDCGCEEPPQEAGCACQVRVSAYRGERVVMPLRVWNRTPAPVTVAATASGWSGSGTPQQGIHLSPASLSLQPGASGVVTATAEVDASFSAGGTYTAEVAFSSGERTERVCVTADVLGDGRAACEVELREPAPAHRCHTWSDHFHCERPRRRTRTEASDVLGLLK